jgi:hypothetical protein
VEEPDSLVYGTLCERVGVAGCGDCAGEGGCRYSIVLVESSAKCGEAKQGWLNRSRPRHVRHFLHLENGQEHIGRAEATDDDGLLSPGRTPRSPIAHAPTQPRKDPPSIKRSTLAINPVTSPILQLIPRVELNAHPAHPRIFYLA